MNESRFVVGAATDVGKLREVNEDAHGYLRASVGEVLVVCDGMGGHASGDVASKLARDAVLGSVLTAAADSDPAAVLTQAAAAAQARVRHASAAGPDRQGMGTTLVCALVQGQRATLANVGDSRAFIVRDGRAQQLSMDHTKGQQLLDGGVISAEQLASHPQKGVLYMALGQMSSEPVPHVVQVQLVEGDYLVLCSDGVYDCMVPDKLAALSSGVNPAYAAANLVRYAVEHDGKDNATVVIGRCLDVDRPVAAPVPLQPRAAPVAQPPAGSAEGSLPQTAGAAGSWRALTPYLLVAAVIGIIVGGIAVHALSGRGADLLRAVAPGPDGGAEADGGAPDAGALAPAPPPAPAAKQAGPVAPDAGRPRDTAGVPPAPRPAAADPHSRPAAASAKEVVDGADPATPTTDRARATDRAEKGADKPHGRKSEMGVGGSRPGR